MAALLASRRFVLASGSANRLALLRQIGIEPVVCPSDFAEDLPRSLPVTEFVEETAKYKALNVADKLKKDGGDGDPPIVIACDTVIYLDGEIIGKPRDESDAFETLTKLNNRAHSVYTGVAICDGKGRLETFHEKTDVVLDFGNAPDELIREYIATGEPFGRAGAYGIQLRAAQFVKEVHGCYNNVIGIPLHSLAMCLRNF
ncbi:hypothetical protein QR680_008575 [Steinernema hermaphroditum]|uniref:Maf-like protein n=1 Tax=Steinernema hermaphroditum TaxID=289476 RepID=A0AA39IH38_9BILA|nr:hypothetical protein QR680_008575 [Steinernema hermaphroditum]